VRQLLNHTSGIAPEAVGAPNDGTWKYEEYLRRACAAVLD
jgi:CubicO group peptidase (beta-lactamase class C family)